MTRLGREWYATQAVTNGWSRSTLRASISRTSYANVRAAVTNFERRLPAADSALACDTLKDPYLFDFLGLGNEAHEREIEDGLVRHITRFLLELGAGFAFVGKSNIDFEVAGDEFFIDLLFYHIRLKCYVVVELKATAFKPGTCRSAKFLSGRSGCAQIKAPDDKLPPLVCCCASNRTD